MALRDVDLEGLVDGAPILHGVLFLELDEEFIVLSLDHGSRLIVHGHSKVALLSHSLVPFERDLVIPGVKVPQREHENDGQGLLLVLGNLALFAAVGTVFRGLYLDFDFLL